MPGSIRGDFYRVQAARVREVARKISAPDIRDQLDRIVLQYEKLADMADRLAGKGRE